MKSRNLRFFYAQLVWLGLIGSLAAQLGSQDPRPQVSAVRVSEGPQIDGDVLQDSAWQGIPASSGFMQTTPDDGEPASEKTEIRVVYTNDTLYIGIVCFDRDPSGIIISDTRRDSSLTETDSIQIILDTYRDEQSGFVFGTNPAGIEYDGQVTKEGAGGGFGSRQQGGSGGGFNLNWDGSWEVRALIDENGWSAEFAIPFTTIRYPSRDVQAWGLNLQRNIRRRNEQAFWAPLDRQFNLYRLIDAGRLTELQIPGQRNLQITPYVLGETQRIAERDRNWVGDGGVDAKYSITPALTLDMTYNTDFAQVEVDEQQVNLDRFNLFFPEKRPFFLENAGLFSVGDPGNVELFFSRRIGIGPDGEVIPIVGGARVTGKVTRNTSIGFLNMQTSEVEGVTPGNNFTVARISRDFRNRSGVGAIFVNRQGTGDFSPESDHNRTFGVDGRLGIGEYGGVAGFAAVTSTPERRLEEEGFEAGKGQYAYSVGGRYESPAWRLTLDYTEVAENFNPEVGFLRRTSYRNIQGLVFYSYRPADLWGLLEVRPHVSYGGFWDFDGFQETGRWHIDNHWEWKNGYEVHTGMNLTREGVKDAFEISDNVEVEPGTYDNAEGQIVFMSNQGAWLSFNFRTIFGGFFGGNRINYAPSMRMRLGDRFITEVNWTHNDIDLPGGDFNTDLARLRVSYSFTPRISIQSLVQYNNQADLWSANVRFAWLQAANTGLFVVYNDTRGFNDFNFDFPDRSLTIKYTRLFNVLE